MGGITQASDFQRRAAELAAQRRAASGVRVKSTRRPETLDNLKYPVSIVGAFLTGMIAVAFARYIRFHLTGSAMQGEDADLTMMLDGAIGAAAGFFIRHMFKFEAKVFLTASNIGVAAMILTMHNFVHYAPTVFDVAFSPDWVREVRSTTDPNTAVFRDMVFTFGDAPAVSGDDAVSETAVPPCGRTMLGNLVERQVAEAAGCE